MAVYKRHRKLYWHTELKLWSRQDSSGEESEEDIGEQEEEIDIRDL